MEPGSPGEAADVFVGPFTRGTRALFCSREWRFMTIRMSWN